tara:strand:+ start:230 stop:364 length:135 start_codon:yes stop_codon:yes gene_type:complete
MDEFEYAMECPICETQVQITVIDIDERPVSCPMCSEEVEWYALE